MKTLIAAALLFVSSVAWADITYPVE